MSDSYAIERNGIDGEDQMGSFNHSTIQIKLGYLLLMTNKNLSVASELSLDVSQYDLSKYRLDGKYEIKPDVCAYVEPPVIPEEEDDLMTVSKMPDLAIEILSPRQATSYLIRKIKAYFALGVKSCWLVDPSKKTVTIYSQPNQYKSFGIGCNTEIVDDVMDIHLSIQEMFS